MVRMDLDHVWDDAGLWSEDSGSVEGNYKLLCAALDFHWITAIGLGAQPPMLLSESEIK